MHVVVDGCPGVGGLPDECGVNRAVPDQPLQKRPGNTRITYYPIRTNDGVTHHQSKRTLYVLYPIYVCM